MREETRSERGKRKPHLLRLKLSEKRKEREIEKERERESALFLLLCAGTEFLHLALELFLLLLQLLSHIIQPLIDGNLRALANIVFLCLLAQPLFAVSLRFRLLLANLETLHFLYAHKIAKKGRRSQD